MTIVPPRGGLATDGGTSSSPSWGQTFTPGLNPRLHVGHTPPAGPIIMFSWPATGTRRFESDGQHVVAAGDSRRPDGRNPGPGPALRAPALAAPASCASLTLPSGAATRAPRSSTTSDFRAC